jgi:hypothetical protein
MLRPRVNVLYAYNTPQQNNNTPSNENERLEFGKPNRERQTMQLFIFVD